MAKRNSIHAALYRFTYSNNLPDNLCPYFWQLVTAVILFIPLVIIRILRFISKQIPVLRNQLPGRTAGEKHLEGFAIFLGGWVVYVFLFCIVNMVIYFFNTKLANQGAAFAGMLFTAIGIIAAIVFVIISLTDRRCDKIAQKKWEAIHNGQVYKPKSNILIDFIKAWYHKHCPKIDWE